MKTLSEILASAGITHEPSAIEGKRDWFDCYGELIGAFDAHESTVLRLAFSQQFRAGVSHS